MCMAGGGVAHDRGAVGGDENGRRVDLRLPAQGLDELEAVRVVEMIIGDDHLRQRLVRAQSLMGAFRDPTQSRSRSPSP